MHGRPAINSAVGRVGPPIVPIRPTGSDAMLPVSAMRSVHSVHGALQMPAELERAGIDVSTVLGSGADALVARTLPSATALSELLERARSAIVRGAPADALAALDEAWEGAERTEGGWYYRGAALTMLGLPGEADRVLQQALARRGGSVALHFLTSVVRALQGDSAGARDALAQAQARRPADQVLLAWQAVLLARQGDHAGARRLLGPRLAAEPGASVLLWAKRAISVASTESARASLSSQRQSDELLDALHIAERRELSEGEPWSALDHALRRLGARVLTAATPDAAHEVRQLLQALAVGGALDRAARPDQIVATRSMLVAILAVLARETASAHPSYPPVASARNAVLTAMRAGSLSNAAQWLSRVSSAEGEAAAMVLRLLLEGAHRELSGESNADSRIGSRIGSRIETWIEPRIGPSPELSLGERDDLRGPTPLPSVDPSRRSIREDDALAVPIRIGLSLLQQSSARDEARTALDMGPPVSLTLPPAPARESGGFEESPPTAYVNARRAGAALRVMALVCMVLAFTALVFGHGVLATALAGGASWLTLRSSAAHRTARRRVRAELEDSESATSVTDSPAPVTSDDTPR